MVAIEAEQQHSKYGQVMGVFFIKEGFNKHVQLDAASVSFWDLTYADWIADLFSCNAQVT